MSMLSRVAERLYWMARYLERAEVTARLCSAHSKLILDIPSGSALGWETLITIIDADEAFNKRYQVRSERNIIKFITADLDNPSSVRFATTAARENVRTTRDVLPEELWEMVNELHLFLDEKAEKSVIRKNRFDFLEEVISRCQRITGLIESAACRDHAYTFLRLGRLVERADMTSRTIDTALSTIINSQVTDQPDFTIVWASLLKSMSAKSAYRREIGPLVEGDEVTAFLLRDKNFPRSILYCLTGIKDELPNLKNSSNVAVSLEEVISLIVDLNIEEMTTSKERQLIDKLQSRIIELNAEIHQSWFLPQS